jgi:hypothetical protein
LPIVEQINHTKMNYPKFYDKVEHIILQDNLSGFLGSSEGGIVDFSYLDMVKVAGHSCVVISGAYLMTLKGLKALYGTEISQRGEIKVEIKDKLTDGNTGVFGQVYSNITGATVNTGFGGIGPHFNRRNLLFYGVDMEANVRFTRLDTGKSVNVFYYPMKVVSPGDIMQMAIGADATEESKREFPIQWQKMVETIFDNAELVVEVR